MPRRMLLIGLNQSDSPRQLFPLGSNKKMEGGTTTMRIVELSEDFFLARQPRQRILQSVLKNKFLSVNRRGDHLAVAAV